MKIAITGAGGFIGRWLRAELRTAGYDVVTMDRTLSYGIDDQFDLLEHKKLGDWLDRHRPEILVHLAAQVSRLLGEDDVSRTIRWNAEATTLVARACGTRAIRLAYASSSEIYGDWGYAEIDETTPKVRLPLNLYGLSKRWGEDVCYLYAPVGLVIFRPSMPYGPGAPPGRGRRAMDTMLWQAHHRMPITVHRRAERSWCYITDTARGIRLALEQPYSGIFNVGRDDDPLTMRQIAEMACELTGAPEDLITDVPAPLEQTLVKRINMNRLRGLGWRPEVEIDEGMKRTYDWISGYDREGARHDHRRPDADGDRP